SGGVGLGGAFDGRHVPASRGWQTTGGGGACRATRAGRAVLGGGAVVGSGTAGRLGGGRTVGVGMVGMVSALQFVRGGPQWPVSVAAPQPTQTEPAQVGGLNGAAQLLDPARRTDRRGAFLRQETSGSVRVAVGTFAPARATGSSAAKRCLSQTGAGRYGDHGPRPPCQPLSNPVHLPLNPLPHSPALWRVVACDQKCS